MSDPVAIDAQNPWPGLREFPESAERFFNGREDEAAALRRLVMQAPLTVMFGASGLGKTSLLQAGLFPLLRQEHCLPVYVRFRINDASRPLVDQATGELQDQILVHDVDAPPLRTGESLWQYLHRPDLELWSADNHLLTPVIVIDQFEEVFTLGAGRAADVARLKVDLADLIENRVPEALAARVQLDALALEGLELNRQRYKVVLSFREDFLPAVEGLKTTIPSIMRNRLRLMPMSGAQAFAAVHVTAPHLADEAMAWRIVNFVGGRRSAEPVTDQVNGLTIEPALLSLVCAGLNERRLEKRKPRFDADLLTGTGHAIVERFYHDKMRDMPTHVHRFVQRELITELGFRKMCDRDDAERVHRVNRSQLQLLVDRRVLRIEPLRDTEWIELTHDLLTPVVRKDRDDQRARDERQRRRRVIAAVAALGAVAVVTSFLAIYAWNARDRAIRAAAEAERLRVQTETGATALTAANNALNDKNQQLTAEKQAADEANRRLLESQASERQARDRARNLAALESEARQLAEARERDANALKIQEQSQRIEAQRLQAVATRNEQTAQSNAELAQRNEALAQRATAEQQRLRNLAIAQDLASRSRLLQREEDLPLSVQTAVHAYVLHAGNCLTTGAVPSPCPPDANDPNVHAALLAAFNRVTTTSRKATFGAGGIVSATGGGTTMRLVRDVLVSARPGTGVVRFTVTSQWRDLGERPAAAGVVVSAPADRRVTAMALATPGFPVAQALLDSRAFQVWDEHRRLYETVEALFDDARLYGQSAHSGTYLGLAFSPDARRLAAQNAAGVIAVWNGQRMENWDSFARTSNLPIRLLAFVPAGNAVMLTAAPLPLIWEFSSRGNWQPLPGLGRDIHSIGFSRDGRRIAAGDSEGRIRVGNWAGSPGSASAIVTIPERHLSPVNIVAFSPSGRLVASAGADGVIRVFRDATPTDGPVAVLEGHRGGVESLVFADDTLLYSGGADRTLRVWPLRTDALAALLCREAARDRRYSLRPGDSAVLTGMLPGNISADSPSLNACAAIAPGAARPDAGRGGGGAAQR